MHNDISEPPVVDAQRVVFSYGNRKVLDDLSLQIQAGSIFGILGANGSGKTTLIRLLVGLLKPRSGRILVLGEPPSPRLAHRIGYMPQLNALYLELSIQQNVDFFARMYGLSSPAQRRESVEAIINLVGLWDRCKDPILRLSGGMRQRVSLAIALVHSPPLLLLDEPTVGLDPELRATFWDRFREMAAAGTTLVISSHTMDDAAHCDRLSFIQDGRVIAEGSPSELRSATGRDDATLEDAFLYFVRSR
ncbi:MAG: ABC transporter ATP-binding protein [Chloroflexi bacterium]|nr:ABC transporter ATP-binding protein [Chloroflexota bacterium]